MQKPVARRTQVRPYTLRQRAESQAQTRARVLEAAIALHEELGPRYTTVSAIAERAGVQRLTVYRHFPDDTALFAACTSTWYERNPPPDPKLWSDIADPRERTRTALEALYEYYRRTQKMQRVSLRDRDQVPALAEPLRGSDEYLRGVRDGLVSAWRPDAATRPPLRAIVDHCVQFSTWQSLNAGRLATARMAQLCASWIALVARGA